MTSNLGSELIQELAGEDNYDAMKAAVMGVVGQHFRPEFINRIDDVVVFHPLAREHIRAITEIQLKSLTQRLHERDMEISFSETVLDKVGEAGFDVVYGARPLRRAIQQMIENPLAQDILSGKFAPGDAIIAELEAGEVMFRRVTEHTSEA